MLTRIGKIKNPIELKNLIIGSFIVCIVGNAIRLAMAANRDLIWNSEIIRNLKSSSIQIPHFFQEACRSQLQNLSNSFDGQTFQDGYSLSGMIPSALGDIGILLLIFAFFGMVSFTYGNVLFKRRLRSFFIVYFVLLLSDQARYVYTSIINPEKKLFSYASFCFQGEVGWALDFIGYAGMYIPAALVITAVISMLQYLSSAELNIKKVGFGVKSELDSIEGCFIWLKFMFISIPIIWRVSQNSAFPSTPFQDISALTIYGLSIYIYYNCIKIFDRLSIWHEFEKEKMRSKISADRGVEPDYILDEKLHSCGLQENAYLKHIGKYHTQALINLAPALFPMLIFLSSWYTLDLTRYVPLLIQ